LLISSKIRDVDEREPLPVWHGICKDKGLDPSMKKWIKQNVVLRIGMAFMVSGCAEDQRQEYG